MKNTNRIVHLLIILQVIILALFAFSQAGAAESNAAAGNGRIGDINGTEYSSLSDLADDLYYDYEGKSADITMYCDWDGRAGHDEFDVPLCIPEDCTATLNMHGHIFNRDNVWDDDEDPNGELIYIEPGASLTINGHSTPEEAQTVHKHFRIFTGNDQDIAPGYYDGVGGCLTGGNGNCGTGGIFIDTKEAVILNDVTIFGCKASHRYDYELWHSGKGAGIVITEDSAHLYLNNSTITGCYAERYGGGIYADNDEFADTHHSIDLDNSHIDYNYADDGGGGINMDGQVVSIHGKNGSSISFNKTHEEGGGVYFWNDEATLSGESSGFTIEGNSADKGGGVYLEEEDQEISGVIIKDNRANTGGGIYVNNDKTSISSCEITGNSHYGVYYTNESKAGLSLSGGVIVKDNTPGNMSLHNGETQFSISQNDNMDIHIGYRNNPTSDDGYQISINIGTDYSDQFTADDPDYVVAYSYRDRNQDDGRRIRYIRRDKESDDRGHHRVDPDKVTVHTQDIHANSEQNKVYGGGYTKSEKPDRVGNDTYQLRRLFAHEGSYDAMAYYSDGFFYDDPFIYNDHIATASYSLASAGCYLSQYSYNYKHAAARQFMADIGCPDQMIYINDGNTTKPGTDTIGVTIGSKHLQKYDGNDLTDTGDVLIAIAVRGANYEREWTSNVTLGDGTTTEGGEAQGFSEAADQVMEAVDYYIDRYGLRDEIEAGKVRFWVSGFSRAGATSNITSKRLLEEYCYNYDGSVRYTDGQGSFNKVFAYPLEAPKGGTDEAEKFPDAHKTKYFCIHNLINMGDVVPYVAPGEMGFKRYGVDHYMPGTYFGIIDTEENYIKRVTKHVDTIYPDGFPGHSIDVTTYDDNSALVTKKEMDSSESDSYKKYADRRDNMVKHLAVIDHKLRFNDYFYPYGTSVNWPPYEKLGKFDGAKLDNYLPNFMAFLQQEAFDHVGYRKKYSGSLQDVARAYMASDADQEGEKKLDALYKAIDKIINNANIIDAEWVLAVIGDYYKLTDSMKEQFLSNFWDLADSNGAFSDLSAEEYEVVKQYWYDIADAAFNYIDGDWQLGSDGQGDPVYPTGKEWVNGSVGDTAQTAALSGSNSLVEDKLIYGLTMYIHAQQIVDIYHSRQIAAAWTRTYDSYYSKNTDTGEIKDGTYTWYSLNWVNNSNPDNYTVEKPGAYVRNSDTSSTETSENAEANTTYIALEETTDMSNIKYNGVDGSQRILLEVGEFHDDVSPTDIRQGDGDVLGETIYYEIYDVTGGEDDSANGEGSLGQKQIYRGGIDLPQSEEGDGKFKIVAYAKSLGQDSKIAVYYISIGHKVTVDNGSGEDPVISYYQSGDGVTISAKPADDKIFANWTVRLVDKDGTEVAPDIAAVIFGDEEKVKNAIVSFTMPEAGKDKYDGQHTYPDGYALEITAVCKYKINKIIPSSAEGDNPIAPATGNNLATTAHLAFMSGGDIWASPDNPYNISWTYKYEDQEKEYRPSEGEEIYGDCIYTAVINVPKDEAQNIVFIAKPDIGETEDIKGKWSWYSVVVDESDGSAVVTIEFKRTESGHEPTGVYNTLRIIGGDATQYGPYDYDMGECAVKQGQTMYVTAKNWDGYQFVKWYFDYADEPYVVPAELEPTYSDRTIKIRIKDDIPSGHDTLTLFAMYIPVQVITDIKSVVEAPVGGQSMQAVPTDDYDSETLMIRIHNRWYTVHPDYIDTTAEGTGSIEWSPDPLIGADGPKADYMTSYTASLRFVPRNNIIKVREKGETSYEDMFAEFVYAENLIVTMNEDKASFDTGSNTLSYTFPKTKYNLVKVYRPEEVTGVPYGTEGDDLKAYLPGIKILLDDGRIMETVAAWGTPEKAFDSLDKYSTHVWETKGTVQLPYIVDNIDDVPLDVVGKVCVDPAESVMKAEPSVEPGKYMDDQRVALISETDGAKIYYTTDPNPYIPQTSEELENVKTHGEWHKYGEQLIPIDRANATEDEIGPDGKPTGRKQITLRVVTLKNNMRPDGVRSYVYVFANEIEVPKGYDLPYTGSEQIGVKYGDHYTLEAVSRGVSIDAAGNAVATDPGTYKVKAKISDGFRWEIINPETGEITYTTDDQTVAFTIAQKPDIRHKVTVDNGSGAAPAEYNYKEGTIVVINAMPADDKYFTSWKVKLLDKDRKTAAEDISGTLLKNASKKTSAKFVMPVSGREEYEPGKVYPEWYSLEITAVCADRITKIEASPKAPVAGKALAETTSLTFTAGKDTWTPTVQYPVSWTYDYIPDNNTGDTPAPETAYNNCVYTATITAPKNEADKILFAPTEELSGSTKTGRTVKSVSRNDADGSATIVIEFKKTDDGGNVPPEADIRLEIKAFDINLNDYCREAARAYDVHQGMTITLTAPEVEDESFQAWDLKATGITLAEGYKLTDRTVKLIIPSGLTVDKLSIDAQYKPVIRKIAAKIAVPEGGKAMQMKADKDTLKVLISNQYAIEPDFVTIKWQPEPKSKEGVKTADYLTSYTAVIGIRAKTDEQGEYIMVKGPSDTQPRRVSAEFLYSEDVSSVVNDKAAYVNKDNNSISFTFPVTRYTLEEIIQPEDITNVPYGTDKKGVKRRLPKTVKIRLDDGSTMDADVVWDDPTTGGSTDPHEPTVWTANGSITLPYGVKKKTQDQDLSVSVRVIVSGKGEYVLTFNLDGGTLNGMTGEVTLSYKKGTVITMPEPAREGYTFDYWEGSRYNAGQEYTVTEDHSFTAMWKKNDPGYIPGYEPGDDTKKSSGRSAKTGDDNMLVLWSMLIGIGILGLVTILGIRRYGVKRRR